MNELDNEYSVIHSVSEISGNVGLMSTKFGNNLQISMVFSTFCFYSRHSDGIPSTSRIKMADLKSKKAEDEKYSADNLTSERCKSTYVCVNLVDLV